MKTHSVLRRLIIVVGAAALVASGCGKESDEKSKSQESTTTSAESTTEPSDSSPTRLEVIAKDHSFDLGEVAQVPAGAVEISMQNQGTEDHAATVVRYKDGKTLDDLLAAGATKPDSIYEVVEAFGGPNAVAPGDTGTATVELEAGKYSILCFIPSPSDMIPHLAKGMTVDIEVTANPEPASLPSAGADISLLDYSFTVPDEIEAGALVKVTDDGEVPHELAIYAPTGDATAEQVLGMLTSESAEMTQGPPPFKGVGGVSPLDPGVSNVTALPSEPGEYVFICFLPTPGSGAPHHTQGMTKIVTLT